MSPDRDDFGPDASRFGDVLEVGSAISAVDFERHEPPADLWERIATNASAHVSPTPSLADSVDSERFGRPGSGSDSGAGSAAPGPVVDLTQRRRGPWMRALAAAAVVVLAASTVGVVLATRDDTSRELVASVELEVLQGEATGSVELVEVDGEQRLELSATNLVDAPEGRHFELWLVDTDITAPQSLGEVELRDGTISVALPDGVDPADFPIVDINLQEDGVAEHSGLDTSVLRGVLA